MKAVVTGAAGFIGSHMVDLLLREGHSVVAVDNESSESHAKFHWNLLCDNRLSDVCDLTPLDFDGVDVVFHMAAEVSIPKCMAHRDQAFSTNVIGTWNVLDCAQKAGVRRLVFSSTSAIYGVRASGFSPPVKETDSIDCPNNYATSKFIGEQLCKQYSLLHGLDTVCLRYFNVFGERQADRGSYSPVIASFLRMRREGKPLLIFGDGHQSRDYVHVSDVVRANLMAADHPHALHGEAVNIGSWRSSSVLEIARVISPDERSICFMPKREGEVRHSLADCSKAASLFGWKAKTDVMDWIRNAT